MSRLGSVCLAAIMSVLPFATSGAQTPVRPQRLAPAPDPRARGVEPREARAPRAPRPARAPRAPRARRGRESPATARIALTRLPSNPYHMRVEVSVEGPDVWEFAADHRLLSFEVTPVVEAPAEGERARPRRRARARTLTCKHPNAGRRVDAAHVLRTPERWSEPLDLRMYCMGRAYDAIVGGATIVPVYGFRRASKTAYLARSVTDPALLPLATVRGEGLVLFPRDASTPGPAPAAPSATDTTETTGPGVEVGLIPTDSTAPNAPVLRSFVRGTRSTRIYMRDDLYTFTITAPDGRTSTCSAPRTVVVPIIDFFKRVSRTSRIETSTDSARYCREIFEEPGIYEVVPALELPYSGERFHIDAVTGRFTGPRSFVRVRPQRGAYVVPRT
jgi:hypothetical protein